MVTTVPINNIIHPNIYGKENDWPIENIAMCQWFQNWYQKPNIRSHVNEFQRDMLQHRKTLLLTNQFETTLTGPCQCRGKSKHTIINSNNVMNMSQG